MFFALDMLVNFYRTLFFIPAFVCYVISLSDPPSASAQLLSSSNQLVEVLNEEIQENWLLHRQLEQLNRALLQADRGQKVAFRLDWRERPARTAASQLTFSHVQAAAMLQPASFQQKLWQNLKTFLHVQKEVAEVVKTLTVGDHMSKEILAHNLIILNQVEELLHKQKELHQKLRSQLSDLSEGLPADPEHPFSMPAIQLEQLVKTGGNLFDALEKGNAQHLRNQLAVFRRTILKVERQGEASLQHLTAQPGSQRDPHIRYQAVLSQAKTLADYADSYLQRPDVPSIYQEYGATYYYYNHVLGNKFSRPGEALVDQYHRFLALSDVPVMKQLIAPGWFKVISPDLKISIDREEAQTVVFLIDVSGSMRQANKMDLFKRTFIEGLSKMNPADQVSLVTYSGTAKLCLPPTPAQDHQSIVAALHQVQVGGKSSPEVGMSIAYRQIGNHIPPERSRIVLISDGGFMIEEPLLDLLDEGKERNVDLRILYMGKEEERMRSRLSRLAERGGGSYTYLRKEKASDILLEQIK